MTTPTKKVLVIDDSEIVLNVVRETLEPAGYQVYVLNSPQEFEVSSVILKEKPGLVLVDVDMPVLQGDQLVDILKGYGMLGTTKVMLHSSKPAIDLAMHAQLCGADGCIQKTSDDDEFLRLINACFDDGESSR